MMDSKVVVERDALERARRIHAECVVVDTLAPMFTCEMMMSPAMVDLAHTLQAEGKSRGTLKTELGDHLAEAAATDSTTRESYLAFWSRAGVTAASTTLYNAGPPSEAWDTLLAELGRGSRLIQGLGGKIGVATSAAAIEQAQREGRHVVIFNLQDAEPIGDRFDRIDLLYGLGIRIVQIAYNMRNRFADGWKERCDGGLSVAGQALIEKLKNRRILIDASHCSDRSTLDILAELKVPIALTHTCARAISESPRGKPDDIIRTVAERGGYVGVMAVPSLILPPGGDGRAEKAGVPSGWATLDTVVDHIVHLLDVAGSDSVGIGTDYGKPYYNVLKWSPTMLREETSGFDWVGAGFDPNMQTQGLETWDMWPNLTAAMLRRGISEDKVVKIVGGNFLRVFRDVCG